MKVERWFIKEDVEPKQFAAAVKINKEFDQKAMRSMVKIIMNSGLDRMICCGVKRRRVRKKIIKKELEIYKKGLQYKILDMMETKFVEAPTSEQDKESKEVFKAFANGVDLDN